MNKEYIKLFLESRLEITFFEFTLLVLIYQNEISLLRNLYNEDFMTFTCYLVSLEQQGYIKQVGSDVEQLSLRKKGDDLFSSISKKHKSVANVEVWIDEWRAIFPEGVNTGGYRYRGNRLDVLKKMTKFVASHSFTKEEIFEATKRYVERFSSRGYNYMQQAHYFIEKKDSGSNLEAECESLKEVKPQNDVEYGRTIV